MESRQKNIDFTKAKQSLTFRTEALQDFENVENSIKAEKALFIELHDELETVRRERAAIVEDLIKYLKEHDIKSEMPLGRYNAKELVRELERILSVYPSKNTEAVELALVKINRRTEEIDRLSEKLVDAREQIRYQNAAMTVKMPESDYEDEVVISLSELKEKAEAAGLPKLKEEDELESVVSVHPASDETIMALNEVLDSLTKKVTVDADIPATDVIDSVLEDLSISSNEGFSEVIEDLDELNISAFLGNEDEDLSDEELDSLTEEDVQSKKCVMGSILSLQKMAEMVYQQEGNEEFKSVLWTGVYNFADNKEIIDERVSELDVDLEYAVQTPGVLAGLELSFPTVLTAYKKVENEEHYAPKVA